MAAILRFTLQPKYNPVCRTGAMAGRPRSHEALPDTQTNQPEPRAYAKIAPSPEKTKVITTHQPKTTPMQVLRLTRVMQE